MSIRTLVKSTVLMCAVFSGIALGQGEQGAVAHWTFDEGKGDVARDATGNGNHAKIVGAKFAKFGKGFALTFDGVDDLVDCGNPPGLDIEKAGAITLWFKPAAARGGLFSRSSGGGWDDERLVLSFKDYGGGSVFVYALADGTGHVYGEMPLPRVNAWSHAALVLSGRRLAVYRDGILVKHRLAAFDPKFADLPLLIGKSEGLGSAFFKGLIDDVRVYNRPLKQPEVVALAKAQAKERGLGASPFEKPKLTLQAYPLSGRLLVGIDYQLMWPLPAASRFDIIVRSDGTARPIANARVPARDARNRVEAILDLQRQPPGPFNVHVQARRADNALLGKSATAEIDWPDRDPMFSTKRGVRILNGFVFELLNVDNPGGKQFTFHNPREGWVYAAVPRGRIAGAMPTAVIDSTAFPLKPVADNFETMQYLAEGPHNIRVGGDHRAKRLIVRAIPELFYNMYGSNPHVAETGNYTWEWLRKHVLDQYNCIIGTQSPEKHEAEIKEWTSEGKRWHTQRSLPWVKTADEAFQYWSTETGMTHPLMSGIWADEFSSGERYRKMYPVWCEALRRIKADPRFRDRQFYAYMGMTYIPEYDPLTKTLMECNLRLAPEWYLREQPTEDQALDYMSSPHERANRKRYDAGYPGAALNRVVILGLLSQPPETCDIHPDVNYSVFLDLQFHFMATDPAFFGTRGLQGYYSPYAGEEQTRVFARLVRHYAIEGRTDRFFKDPYILPHLKNPDFTEALNDWTLSPAAPGAIAPRTVARFGNLQARFDATGTGDTVLWTQRSARKPNAFSQPVKDLQPGRPYSLRFFTGNYRDFMDGTSRDYKHSIAVKLEEAKLIADKCFQAQIKMGYWHKHNTFDRNRPYYLNYHQVVFRPKASTSRLTLSDWAGEKEPGGPEGAELIWNFIQIQPYFPE